MATTSDHIAARSDMDLQARFVAKAEQMEIPNAQTWISLNMGSLVAQKVDGELTVTDVYAYANNSLKEYLARIPPRPGENLGAVTDTNLAGAILALRVQQETP